MATIRQKLAYKAVVKGSTISGAMVKAGYSKETAKRTNKLTRTKGWQELIDKFISEEALLKVHKEGLDATRDEQPDYAVRHKYLETGYKVRGRMKEQPNGNTYNTVIFTEEQQRRIAGRIFNQPESETAPDRLPDSNEPEI